MGIPPETLRTAVGLLSREMSPAAARVLEGIANAHDEDRFRGFVERLAETDYRGPEPWWRSAARRLLRGE